MIKQVSPDKLPEYIKNRILSDWVLVIGDPTCIQLFWYNLYPPFSEEDQNFELIVPGHLPNNVYPLAKKTENLRRYLESFGLTGVRFDQITVIEFQGHEDQGEQVACKLTVMGDNNNREEAVKIILEALGFEE